MLFLNYHSLLEFDNANSDLEVTINGFHNQLKLVKKVPMIRKCKGPHLCSRNTSQYFTLS
jgi:hypothetical protein